VRLCRPTFAPSLSPIWPQHSQRHGGVSIPRLRIKAISNPQPPSESPLISRDDLVASQRRRARTSADRVALGSRRARSAQRPLSLRPLSHRRSNRGRAAVTSILRARRRGARRRRPVDTPRRPSIRSGRLPDPAAESRTSRALPQAEGRTPGEVARGKAWACRRPYRRVYISVYRRPCRRCPKS
jgi:hypothetical protein